MHEKLMGQGAQSWRHSLRRAAQSQGGGGQALAHEVVTPSQVTWPGSPTAQFRSTAVQLVELLFPEQLTEPTSQAAVAVHRAFLPMAGRLAASTGAGVPTGAAREARKA